MQFARHLRSRIASGEIECTVRVWHRPHVKVGGRYRMEAGRLHVTSVREIAFDDVTDALARRSGFEDADDLLTTARHGSGENVYLIEFTYEGLKD
jgi:hypothetical protein